MAHRNSWFTYSQMVIFHSYVSLPEGNAPQQPIEAPPDGIHGCNGKQQPPHSATINVPREGMG